MSSGNIDIVIGAKNKASQILEQVGNDTKKLTRNVAGMASSTEAATGKMGNAFKGLTAAAAPLLAAVAAAKAAVAAISFGSDSIEAFNVQEQAVRGLGKAIDLAGGSAAKTLQSHVDFAAALQNTVNVGDEVTIGLMKQASMLGVAEGDLQNVTKAAIGMSEATGASLQDSLRKVNETMHGNTAAFAEFLPQLRQATTDEERLAIVMQTAENGLRQQADAAGSLQGIMARNTNSFGDLKERIGELLAPMKAVISQGLAVFVERLQGSLQPAIDRVVNAMGGFEPIMAVVEKAFTAVADVIGVYADVIVRNFTTMAEVVVGSLGGAGNMAETFGNIIDTVKETVITGLTFAEVAFNNLGDVVGLAMDYGKLSVLSFSEDIKHYFTDVIPGYATWMGQNVYNIIADSFNATVTVAQNSLSRIGEYIEILWDHIKSGFSEGLSGVMVDIMEASTDSLLEGFEARTAALPQIAARAITAGEQELKATIGAVSGRLGEEFNSKLAARLAGPNGAGAGILGDLSIGNLGGAGALGEQIGKGIAAGQGNQSAVTSRLLTRGQAASPMEKVEKLLTDSLAELKKVNQREENKSKYPDEPKQTLNFVLSK